ncbi:hypothetical protein [Actinopolymorpha alba]|uniref:hypothetical protein n=1 Tax=Actinopolymorpha alba TaxID=533267 RepID=UPI0003782BA1|nr:hypothetical protein [Actinopolymorpha alba]
MNLLSRVGASAGLAGLLPLLLLYAASGLVAPLWAVCGLVVVWVVLVVFALRWFRRRPWAVLAMPFAGVAVWLALLQVGESFLGWTA